MRQETFSSAKIELAESPTPPLLNASMTEYSSPTHVQGQVCGAAVMNTAAGRRPCVLLEHGHVLTVLVFEVSTGMEVVQMGRKKETENEGPGAFVARCVASSVYRAASSPHDVPRTFSSIGSMGLLNLTLANTAYERKYIQQLLQCQFKPGPKVQHTKRVEIILTPFGLTEFGAGAEGAPVQDTTPIDVSDVEDAGCQAIWKGGNVLLGTEIDTEVTRVDWSMVTTPAFTPFDLRVFGNAGANLCSLVPGADMAFPGPQVRGAIQQGEAFATAILQAVGSQGTPTTDDDEDAVLDSLQWSLLLLQGSDGLEGPFSASLHLPDGTSKTLSPEDAVFYSSIALIVIVRLKCLATQTITFLPFTSDVTPREQLPLFRAPCGTNRTQRRLAAAIQRFEYGT